jgi:hypothetical protein
MGRYDRFVITRAGGDPVNAAVENHVNSAEYWMPAFAGHDGGNSEKGVLKL